MEKPKIKTEGVTIINRQGMSFFAALTIILIVLKVLGYNIEWFWIVAAFFGPVILLGFFAMILLSLLILCFILSMAAALYDGYQDTKRNKMAKEVWKERQKKWREKGKEE